MNLFTAKEIIQNYSIIGGEKALRPAKRLLPLAVMAGLIIGLGGAVTNTATHSIADVSTARIIAGLLFPFGLGIVMLMGAELFTGNCMIAVSVADGRASVLGMLRNWVIVYAGNFIGAALLAIALALCGQFDYSGGELAVFTIKLAAAKCGMGFWSAVVMGVLCNVLVCLGVLCSLSAKDAAGRIMGAYIPVAFFVICGFEHSVANMFYIPAGIFANGIPKYAALANNIDTSMLNWLGFIRNMVPVTLGNIIGGAGVGLLFRYAYKQ